MSNDTCCPYCGVGTDVPIYIKIEDLKEAVMECPTCNTNFIVQTHVSYSSYRKEDLSHEL